MPSTVQDEMSSLALYLQKVIPEWPPHVLGTGIKIGGIFWIFPVLEDGLVIKWSVKLRMEHDEQRLLSIQDIRSLLHDMEWVEDHVKDYQRT